MVIRSAHSADIDAIRALLTALNLPAADVSEAASITFFVAEDDTRTIAGCVGLEGYGNVGLLRSLAVRPNARDAGVGGALVTSVQKTAASRGILRIYILTTTANDFFAQYGYQPVARDTAPDAIRGTTQFAELCPRSATFMVKQL